MPPQSDLEILARLFVPDTRIARAAVDEDVGFDEARTVALEIDDSNSHHERIDKSVHARKIVLAMVGAVVGTVSLCGLMSPAWGVLGWTVSVLSLVRLLSLPRRAVDNRLRPSVGYRVALASVAVFCLLFLAAMLTAFNANPQVLGRTEIIVGLALTVVGILSIGISLRM
jgi:hypothetical protein